MTFQRRTKLWQVEKQECLLQERGDTFLGALIFPGCLFIFKEDLQQPCVYSKRSPSSLRVLLLYSRRWLRLDMLKSETAGRWVV